MKISVALTLLFLVSAFLPQQSFSQSGGQNPALVMYRWNGGGISPQPVVQSNLLGTVRWDGLTGVGNIQTGASILSTVANPVSPGFLMANMVFRTSGAAGLKDRMIITENGLVGIGTMTPQYHLHVVGNTHTTGDFFGRIHFDNNATTNDAPNTYIDEAYFERKNSSVLTGGIVLPASAGAQGGTLTLAPGGSSLDHQIYFGDDGLWTRRKTGNAADWTGANWYRLLTGEQISGTPNRIAKFTASNSLGDSQLFDDGSRVGIRNLTPGTDIDLTGATRITGNLGLGAMPTANRLEVSGNSRLDGNLTVDGATNSLTVNGTTRLVGKVAIGAGSVPTTGAPDHSLYVGGSILTEEVKVELKASWPDYVFENSYSLTPLSDVEQYIGANKHLPGIASSKEIAENGLHLGAMQNAQMEKIEELFLHMIALEKRVSALEAQNKQLQAENAVLKANSDNGSQRN